MFQLARPFCMINHGRVRDRRHLIPKGSRHLALRIFIPRNARGFIEDLGAEDTETGTDAP